MVRGKNDVVPLALESLNGPAQVTVDRTEEVCVASDASQMVPPEEWESPMLSVFGSVRAQHLGKVSRSLAFVEEILQL